MKFFWDRSKDEPNTPIDAVLATRSGPIPIAFVDKDGAMAEWQRKVADFPQTKKWPLLIGPAEKAAEFAGTNGMDENFSVSPREILVSALQVNVEELLESRLADLTEIDDDDDDFDDFEPTELEVDLGELDRRRIGPQQPSIVIGSDEQDSNQIGLVEIPCAEPWQVFTVRPFGGWNEVPEDPELTAVLKSWYDRFGAVPIGFTDDVIELWLPTPIRAPEIAARIATEMYAFCSDIVDQGTESLQALAQELLNAHVWFFWWD